MNTLQLLLGILLAAALFFVLLRQFWRESAKRADQGRLLFDAVRPLLENSEVQRGTTVGIWTLTGRYRDQQFQFKTVADTLATRKLPSLWLMVTLPGTQPVSETTDLMMRAAGISSFSNFDFLPHTLAPPDGFPEQATLRSDVAVASYMPSLLARHLDLFHRGRGKEFLVTPKGLRIVLQLAEADKARYGVFREANFAEAKVDAALARQMMDTLIELQNDIQAHART